MKTNHLLPLLAASLLAPSAALAQNTATTAPVGYETVNLVTGFNYIGLRLHNSAVLTGTLETVTNSSLADSGTNINSSLEAGQTYILEITDTAGVGCVAEITKNDVVNDTISVTNAFTALGVTTPATYTIRPAATLASVFGATNKFGLQPGFSGPGGADLIYVPEANGGFKQYFYDEDESSWKNAENNSLVDANQVPLVYLDGILVFANSNKSLLISGTIKKEPVLQVARPGFNYLGSVFPAGATLATALNGSLSSINPGFSGPADADLIYVVNNGVITQYFYDEDETSWKNATTNTVIDPQSIDLPSGLIYFKSGSSASNIKNSPPAIYSGL